MACRCDVFTFAVDAGQYLVGVLVQMNGCLRLFQPLMEVRILLVRSRAEVNVPHRMAWRSMVPNQTSIRFSHEPEVGVKRMWIRGWVARQAFTPGLVGRVVVHHQVQLDLGMGAGDMLEEDQELLMPVPLLAQPGHLPGGDLRSGEQGR